MTAPTDHQPLWVKSSGFLLDRIAPRVRPLFWPIYALVRMLNLLSRLSWTAANEYQKSRFAYCGVGVRLHGRCQITAPDKLSVGDNVHINTNAFIRAEGGLSIGDNVHISRNLVLYTINHNFEGARLPYDQTHLEKPVSIGKNVWIGMNVMITPGVTIGDGAIIGMGTVVSRDVASLEIVGNAPQRVIRQRNPKHYDELERHHSYGGMSGYPTGMGATPPEL